MAARLSVSRAELKVLLQHYNSLADRNVNKQVRIEGSERYELVTRSFIRKLLVAGLRSGDITLPACFTGTDPRIRRAAEQGASKQRRRLH